MKIKLIYLLLICLVLSACKTQKNQGNNEGFVTLFNGKNWDGWHLKIRSGDAEAAQKVFGIDKGLVHVFKDMPDSTDLNNGKNLTHGLFYTDKKYSMFIFKFEYKWGKKITNNFSSFQYDAGLYYHVIDEAIWPKGIEYQVRYNHLKNKNHTGDFWGMPFKVWTADENKQFAFAQDGGKLQAVRGGERLAKATTNFNALDDKWNQCEVIVMGDKYAIHKLNGEVINVAYDLPVGEGTIGLQSETAEVFYRNIKIKEFKEFVPIEKFLFKK